MGSSSNKLEPDSISRVLTSQMVVTDTITISNTSAGNSTLNFQISLENNTFPEGSVDYKFVPVPNYSVEHSADDKDYPSKTFGFSIEGQGGPDAFGYKWIDSDEPNGPAYIWNDISSTGTLINAWIATGTFEPKDEGYAGPFSLGFNFKFYGNNKTQLYVSSNGFLHFAPLSANSFTNAQIPSTSAPNEYIAPFWDDLDGRTQGTVHYKQDGNKFIVQFTNWQRYSATGSLTFQAVLYSSGKILFYYNNMNATLNSATIGIENNAGNIGLQTAYNAAYAANNKAVQISAEPDWLSSNSVSGLLYNQNSFKVLMTFKSEDFTLGNYSMNMIINNNDPVTPIVNIPIKMRIKVPDTLKVMALIEGFYNLSSMVSDTITAELRSASSPYTLSESNKIVLNNSGFGKASFLNTTEGTNYYLVLKHRNSIETWSAAGLSFTAGLLDYDFTTAQNKAYGNNLVPKGTKWCIYSGDVNQDGFIDGSDYLLIANNWEAAGIGLAGDVNGDQYIDGSDYVAIANNWERSVIKPLIKIIPTPTGPINDSRVDKKE